MAGFDFEFDYGYGTDADYELARRLLRHLQWRARYYGLEMHYRVNRETLSYTVVVDGPLPGMQAFAPRLTLEVFTCAEFAEQPKPAWRRTDIAWDLSNGYREGLEKISDAVHEVSRAFQPVFSSLAPATHSLGFDLTGVPTHLHGPLRRFEATVAMYANLPVMLLPTLPTEEAQVVEEAHTATELLLRTALGVRTLSYAQMADRAKEHGWVDAEQHRLLIQLKELRKRVKHRGQDVRPLRAYKLVMNAVECSHRLVTVVAGK